MNYLIECCVAATGMQPSPEYMLKDGFDGTTVLHCKSFVPGQILLLAKRNANIDMIFFDANVRESLKFSISKVDEAARIHHLEEVKEKMLDKCKLFGKDIINSPLKSGIK